MKSLTKTVALTFLAGLLSANVMAAGDNVTERFIDIDGSTYKLTEVSKTGYDFYADELKSNLTSLQQAQGLEQFQSLLSKTKDLALNAKKSLGIPDGLDGRAKRAALNQMTYQEWKLGQLIDSLDTASNQSDLSQAKDAVLFEVASSI
ncbi:hypothetical protein ACLSYX_11320 [[Pasteurella] aerogenes]|uniref:Uncharacterized protein n=1 Tax=[Pasteurella] mairii TaxID=757 RepID=A0A379B7Q7_9PAST|nr:hypothetical protein [[Pasteurella] mairii]SUB34110.1 Uncharacterised protein [[Pasteurella] mairii]